MADPIMDLEEILSSLEITSRGTFVYASVPAIPADVDVLAAVWEAEGLCAIIPSEYAATFHAASEPVFACLTLEVYSALESVGLTAAVSTTLAQHGISCNVIAGLNHDHLLVPVARADEAISVLGQLTSR